jgi:hypothetical protein
VCPDLNVSFRWLTSEKLEIARRWNISEKSCNIADIAKEARHIVRFGGCNWLRGEQEGTGKEAFVATAVCAPQNCYGVIHNISGAHTR